jgi:hypothetical protein
MGGYEVAGEENEYDLCERRDEADFEGTEL